MSAVTPSRQDEGLRHDCTGGSAIPGVLVLARLPAALIAGQRLVGHEPRLQGLVRWRTAHAVVERAWALGLRYFDTAPLYGVGLAERRLGAGLRGKPREGFAVSTKVGRLLRPGASAWHGAPDLVDYFDFSYDAALRSLEESLEQPCRS
jgi:predicted oxidoreductase